MINQRREFCVPVRSIRLREVLRVRSVRAQVGKMVFLLVPFDNRKEICYHGERKGV